MIFNHNDNPLRTVMERFILKFAAFFIFLGLVLGMISLAHPSLVQASSDLLPGRIVSLKPNITQILIDLEVQGSVVGITRFCPQVGDHAQVVADYTNIEIEAVARLKPDLVLISSENTQSRQVETLKKIGVPVILVEFRDYDEMIRSVLLIGDLVGKLTEAEILTQKMEATLASTKALAQGKLGAQNNFAVIVQRRPLMLASDKTYVSSLLTRAGLRNAFGTNQVAYPIFDDEVFMHTAVDFLFELEHEGKSLGERFLGKIVIAVRMEDFLAVPGSVAAVKELVLRLPLQTPY